MYFNLHISTKSYLLIQIGKAPVRKLQRHFSSSRPRCLSKIIMIYILRNILNLLQMFESKTRNISHHSHSCYLSFFFHGYQLKQCEGSCEQLLTWCTVGIPLTKPKYSLPNNFSWWHTFTWKWIFFFHIHPFLQVLPLNFVSRHHQV